MTNLKNVLVRNDTSAYFALAEVVAICGIESVLSALSEIAAEQYVQQIGLSPSLTETPEQIIVTINGQDYAITPNR